MTSSYERELFDAGFSLIAGADEAGRGACAGPLVAAAVIWPRIDLPGIVDSKKLTAAARAEAYTRITDHALAWACVAVPAAECDRLGIQQANLSALRRAILRLSPSPEYAVIDGFGLDGLPCPSLGIWKGDQVAVCVSAASIVAKVTRDRMMDQLQLEYPEYGFDVHKGYCTKAHQQVLDRLGPCPEHRLSFDNVPAAR
ncbi:MAG: ribonuclease HII [Propionibacteriaceae bacterium]|jgi:ribonuclease HII|nr:ribonuclease HII [Propionibacteriaceae bacterium]